MDHAAMNPLDGVTELIATVIPVSGSNVKGSVTFKKVPEGVEVTVSVGGLEPGSEHGFHVHEFGNVNSSDGNSAGGHYNPEGHDHGLMEKNMRHAGDLGNLKADNEGNANKTFTVDNITLAGMKNPIIGRAVVIHAKKDDGGQPTGNAGDRIGVGVIGIAKTDKPAK
jgi:Cu-Zn family superoxide dismutase